MPEQSRAVERACTGPERSAFDAGLNALGETTYDIHLNVHAYWRNVPANVWTYRLGGYQVLKKWLSYREQKVLGRALRAEEVHYFSEVARRTSAILSATARPPLKTLSPAFEALEAAAEKEMLSDPSA